MTQHLASSAALRAALALCRTAPGAVGTAAGDAAADAICRGVEALFGVVGGEDIAEVVASAVVDGELSDAQGAAVLGAAAWCGSENAKQSEGATMERKRTSRGTTATGRPWPARALSTLPRLWAFRVLIALLALSTCSQAADGSGETDADASVADAGLADATPTDTTGSDVDAEASASVDTIALDTIAADVVPKADTAPPVGGCCTLSPKKSTTGECVEKTQSECGAGFNWYPPQRNGCSSCLDERQGACCFSDGTCQDSTTVDACAGGTHKGESSTCAAGCG